MKPAASEEIRIRLTPAAEERMRALVAASKHTGLRLAVRPAGCSGLEYDLDYADAPQSGDLELTFDDFVLYVDGESYDRALKGLTIDFHRDPLSSGFVYINPNKKGECGCGASFSV